MCCTLQTLGIKHAARMALQKNVAKSNHARDHAYTQHLLHDETRAAKNMHVLEKSLSNAKLIF